MKTLVIEDNLRYVETLKAELLDMTTIDVALDGAEGLYMAESNIYDLILINLMLPKISGLDVVRKIREKSTCPIVVISSIQNIDKLVEILHIGADDYILRPYDSRELIARINAILRRCNNSFYEIYRHKNISLDYRKHMFCVDGKYIKFSGKTYDVLEYLIRNKNIIISKEQLFNRVWGSDCDTVITVTEVYVSKVRNLLKKCGVDKYLRTIKNVGYMWEDKTSEI